MEKLKEKFLIDENGRKKAVVLDIDVYRRLLEDMDDLKTIAERKNEATLSLKEAEKRLKQNGII